MVTFLLAVAHLLVEHAPNLTKDVVRNQLATKPALHDRKVHPKVEVRLSAPLPKIVHDDLPQKVAGDIDTRKYRYRGTYCRMQGIVYRHCAPASLDAQHQSLRHYHVVLEYD